MEYPTRLNATECFSEKLRYVAPHFILKDPNTPHRLRRKHILTVANQHVEPYPSLELSVQL